MGKVIFDISVSVDGYVNGPNDRPEDGLGEGGEALHDWLMSGDAGGREVLDELQRDCGAVICGARTFDNSIENWGRKPVGPMPCFVLTNDGERAAYAEECGFRVATEGIERAVAAAREVAGPDKDVVIMGGAAAGRSALNAGLVDEVQLHVAPVFLGGGNRLFDGVDIAAVGLTQDRVVETAGATHVRYAVGSRR